MHCMKSSLSEKDYIHVKKTKRIHFKILIVLRNWNYRSFSFSSFCLYFLHQICCTYERMKKWHYLKSIIWGQIPQFGIGKEKIQFSTISAHSRSMIFVVVKMSYEIKFQKIATKIKKNSQIEYIKMNISSKVVLKKMVVIGSLTEEGKYVGLVRILSSPHVSYMLMEMM